jgi:hypothetical protein
MTYQFICELWPKGGIEQTLKRTPMLERWQRFASPSKRVRLRRRGGDYGLWIPVDDALVRVRDITKEPRAGVRVITQRRTDKRELAITKIEAEDVPDLGCAPALEAIHHYLWGKYGARIRSGGRGFCRYVDGTFPPGIVSRHGYEDEDEDWFGAAEDVFVVEPNTMEFLYEVARDLVAQAKAGKLEARDIICGDKRWRASNGFREEHYSGLFHRHIHVDVEGGGPCTP